MTFFHWPMTSWWRNMSDICDLLNILEILYYHVDTLVTGYCVPWLHLHQTKSGADKCSRTGNFSLLMANKPFVIRKCPFQAKSFLYNFYLKIIYCKTKDSDEDLRVKVVGFLNQFNAILYKAPAKTLHPLRAIRDTLLLKT